MIPSAFHRTYEDHMKALSHPGTCRVQTVNRSNLPSCLKPTIASRRRAMPASMAKVCPQCATSTRVVRDRQSLNVAIIGVAIKSIHTYELCGRVDWTGRRPRMISAFPSWNGRRRRTWDDIRHLMDSGSGKDLGFRMFWAVRTFSISFLLTERLRGEGNESGPPPKPSTLSKWSEDGGPLWLRGIASSGHPTRSPDQVGVRCQLLSSFSTIIKVLPFYFTDL
ncbi:hypothetical protein FB446DRAFT_510242 [Lentinula raphanica]|nr:hypothetical protein FB446DRAFT_510242 [Lentinula raphanica]